MMYVKRAWKVVDKEWPDWVMMELAAMFPIKRDSSGLIINNTLFAPWGSIIIQTELGGYDVIRIQIP